jgi:hypothetical protein
MRRLLAAAAVAALAASASASIVLRVTPRELADTANLVAEGRVASVDVRWDDARTCINTYVTLTVDRVLKGTASGSVVIKVPGGRVGDEEVRVEGTAKFERDEQVVVFLWRDVAGDWIVLGEAQGKFRVWQDEKAGKRMAGNSLKGLCLVMRGGGKEAGAASARRPDTLPYDDLASVVKASVDAAKAPPPKTGTTAPALPPVTPPGGTTAEPPLDGTAGRDPAPPTATPDPPSTSNPPGDGAPPPPKDVPAPKAGSSDTPGAGQTPPPAPAKE